MLAKVCVLLVSSILGICESSFLDSLKPCKIDDGKCQGDLVQSVLRDIGKPGLPEIGLESFDPLNFKNWSLNVLNIVKLSLPEGQLKGIKNCQVHTFGTDIDKRHTWMDMTCNLTVKSKYKVFSNSELIHGLTGGQSIHGEGNGKVKAENLKIKFDYYFVVQKKNNEIYMILQDDTSKFTYELAGKMTFFADQLYIGKDESSKMLVALMNDNYKILVENFGENVMNSIIKIVFKLIHKFFDNVPARRYISDDLSAYLN